MRSDVTKQEAAEVLSDEIFELQFACTKAAFILQEITENYFGRYDSTNHSEHWKIAWDYERYSALGSAVEDYVLEMQQSLKKLNNLYKQELSYAAKAS